MKKLFIFLIFISTAISLANILAEGWYFRKEKIDLPNETKKLIIDTIQRELSVEVHCTKDGCKKEVKNLENVVDEISYANQLGRLDIISSILAMFGLIIGVGAIFGFLHIKESSRLAAREEVKDWLFSDRGKDEIKKMLETTMKSGAKTEGNIGKNQPVGKNEIETIIEHIEEI